MLKIHIQQKAKADLKTIWHYTYNKWGEAQADAYFAELSEKLNAITDNPKIGTSCDYIRDGYRKYQINKHIVFYKFATSKIQIIRILHHKMDYKRQFTNS